MDKITMMLDARIREIETDMNNLSKELGRVKKARQAMGPARTSKRGMTKIDAMHRLEEILRSNRFMTKKEMEVESGLASHHVHAAVKMMEERKMMEPTGNKVNGSVQWKYVNSDGPSSEVPDETETKSGEEKPNEADVDIFNPEEEKQPA